MLNPRQQSVCSGGSALYQLALNIGWHGAKKLSADQVEVASSFRCLLARTATSLFAFKNPSRKSSVTMESSFALMSSAAASRRCRAVRSSGDSSTISAGSPVTFSSSRALETNDDCRGFRGVQTGQKSTRSRQRLADTHAHCVRPEACSGIPAIKAPNCLIPNAEFSRRCRLKGPIPEPQDCFCRR